MDAKKYNLRKIENSELKEINGGVIGAVVGIAGLVLAGATALGYYDAKRNCIPPPCE
ncbi:MAG: class IIb bacteriocin, lactobin A/cerein 7B family [Balneolaceae bacterium]|nr:class IIb bacteriocin, lactobin A/cerein 7B family [Balneolaceae bacterium]